MEASLGMRAIKDLLSFPFREPGWQAKFIIGSLLIFATQYFPILPILPVLGYIAVVLRDSTNSEGRLRLPEWNDWNTLFGDGLRLFGVNLILTLPGALIMIFGYIVYMVAIFGISSPGYSSRGSFGAIFIPALLFLMISMAVGGLLSLIGSVMMPPALAHVANTRRFGAFFTTQWLRILARNWTGFLLTLLVMYALAMMIYWAISFLYLTVVLCCLIPFVTAPVSFYVLLIGSALGGQAYREGRDNLREGLDKMIEGHDNLTA